MTNIILDLIRASVESHWRLHLAAIRQMILEGMALVQKLKGNDHIFFQLADSALSHVLHEGFKSHPKDVVFDFYRNMFTKNTERVNRGANTEIQFKNIAPGHKIQHWRKLFCIPANKTALNRFNVDEWKSLQHTGNLME